MTKVHCARFESINNKAQQHTTFSITIKTAGTHQDLDCGPSPVLQGITGCTLSIKLAFPLGKVVPCLIGYEQQARTH